MAPGVYFLLFVAGLVAGVMNTVGGGGSVLTLPALIFSGLTGDVANATNRIGIIAQNVVAVWQFERNGIRESPLTWRVTLAGLGGCVIGARAAALIPAKQFEYILGWFMLALLVLIIKRPKPHLINGTGPDNAWTGLKPQRKWKVLATFFLLGIYSGFLQAGVGIMILVALGYLVEMDLVRANYVKLAFVLVLMPVSLATFMFSSVRIEWTAGIVLTAGQMAGAYAGSWVAIRKGEKWILAILVVCILFSSAKLLGLFAAIATLWK
jgi:uncharacterized protein